MRFQRLTQTVTLSLFVCLVLLTGYPLYDGLAVDLLLRLDPLLGVGTIIAARHFVPVLLPGLIVLASCLLVGRLFCGHVCPMGTTLDLLERPLGPNHKPSVKNSSYEATVRYRTWKYLGLTAILGATLAGVSLVHLGSPLSLVTRLYALGLYPVAALLGESGLALVSPLFSTFGLYELSYIQISQKVFATNVFVAGIFAAIVLLAYSQPRFWCRNLCPAGALMGLFSRRSLFRRKVDASSCSGCGRCIRECPTGAISEDPVHTVHSECIMCLHCQQICPEGSISFGPGGGSVRDSPASPDPTRRGIIVALGTGLLTAGLLRTGINQPRALAKEMALVDPELIRPPGAMPEPDFLARCVRCGECMKVCPTNTLQPVWFKAGLEGIFSPVVKPRLAACAANCNACGKVCPTGAIRDLPLEEKQHAKVGTAWINRQNCLVWEQDKKCLVCDEVCPYGALSFRPVAGLRNAAPFVLENHCTGCGQCETKCPVEGQAAIRVNIIGEIRLASGSYVEKAREYGMVFRAKDTSMDRLAPGTFDGLGPSPADEAAPKSPKPSGGSLPPGFMVE